MIKDLVPYTDKILHEPTLIVPNDMLVSLEGRKTLDLVTIDLEDSIRFYKGLGLAANQIGHEWRILAMLAENSIETMINPTVTFFSPEKETELESCLSYPNLAMKVERSKWVRVRYVDKHGQKQARKFHDLQARIIQHELNHLDGKTFFEDCSNFVIKRAIKKCAKKTGIKFDLTKRTKSLDK